MIVAYINFDPAWHQPNHQPVNNVLEAYARSFVSQIVATPSVIAPPAATAANIQAALALGNSPLFFFGHGEQAPAALLGHDMLAALDAGTCHFVANRVVCAIACHGVDGLGSVAAASGTTVVGYSGILEIPVYPPYDALAEPAILDSALALSRRVTASAAVQSAKTALTGVVRHLQGSHNVLDQLMAAVLARNTPAYAGPDRTI